MKTVKNTPEGFPLRDKVLAIKIMELYRPGGFNTSFVDRIERCLHKIRLRDPKTTFEVEDILDYLLWDPHSTNLTS
jgi:hypothetical protein